jgi:hypothetical protein
LDEEEPVGIDWSYNDTHWYVAFCSLNVQIKFNFLFPSMIVQCSNRLGMDEHTGLAGIDLSALPLVDWDSLEIQEEKEEEGIIEICNEQQLYGLLGLKKDGGSTTQMVTESFSNSRAATTDASGMLNMQITQAVAIDVTDHISEERTIAYDEDSPCMKLGTPYPSMEKFRLAMRQYGINKEFELGIEATCPNRYRGFCKSDGCPWTIVGHKQADNITVMVTVLNDVHTCTSSSRRKTTTPTCKWVASKAVVILRENPQMRCVELQKKLEKDYKCKIGYDTVWRGREKALDLLCGSWKAEILKRSPDSVVEIDCKVVSGRVYFHRFFCALGPCIEGFKSGCRPWLGIDSTALNGRWNGHLAAATGVDGHN